MAAMLARRSARSLCCPSATDKGVISYLTPVAMALLNHKVGDEVEFELYGTKRRSRINKIDPWRTEAPPEAPEAETPTAG